MLGGRYAGEARLGGLFSFPVDLSTEFAPLAFSLSIQTLGGDISLSTFVFTFSALSSKALLSVGLISGAGPLVGTVSVEETFSTSTVKTPIIRSKSNNESLEVYISDFTPRLTAVVLDGFLLRAISEPDLVLPLIEAKTKIWY